MENKGFSKHKYLQLATYITDEIQEGKLSIGQKIPSVNQLSELLKISKSTVMAGLTYLSEKGIIESVNRKGYYVKKSNLKQRYRIFFLMDQLTIFKEELYNSFFNTIHKRAEVDVFFHNYNSLLFERLILENINNYTHFVVIPNLKGDVSSILNQIPPKKRLILDYNYENLDGEYAVVYQDFEGDIYHALVKLAIKLKKYKRLILVSPKGTFYSNLVKKGFVNYCNEYHQDYAFIECIKDSNLSVGDCYITLNRYDTDDVDLIKQIHNLRLKLGKDIGLISYNDFYVKEVLEGGITVISTDFARMGEDAAKLILNNTIKRIKNRSNLKIRNSI